MTIDMLKYSQVVWAYFILDAVTLAVTKSIDFPRENFGYQVQEEPSELRPIYKPFNVNVPLDQIVLPTRLGLFVAQPLPLEQQVQASEISGPESRNGFGFGYSPVNKKIRIVNPKGLSLYSTENNKGRYKDLFNKYGREDYGKRKAPLGSDRYLTPNFVKFKNEIEKETEKTHMKGINMSKDTIYSPTVVYKSPKFKKFYGKDYTHENNPIPLSDESFRRPYYDEPDSDDDIISSPYSKPVSNNQFSSLKSSEPYAPPNFDSSEIEFPPYPPLPPLESESPHSESEARNQYNFNSGNSDYPSSFQNMNDHQTFPSFKKHPIFHNEDEDDETTYSTPNFDSDLVKNPPRKYVDADEYRKPLAANNFDVPHYHHEPKRRRNHLKRNKFGRPYGQPSQVPVPISRNEDDEEEFDTNYEPPADLFLNDENLESEEEEEEPSKGRLIQPSKKQPKRVQQPTINHKKKCVKKRKDMSLDDLDDELGREMVCLECENLDTGGTYETCSYESDPKKNSYYKGNAASYHKGGPKSPYKYRFRRQTITLFNSSGPHKRVIRRTKKDDNTGSYTADPDDFGPENFSYDDNEELQEENDDDEFEEYTPQPPAYANEHSCKQVIRNGATCMVCRNPETNGKYEQCSYANEPDDAYEYAQSSKYGKKNVPYHERKKRSYSEDNSKKMKSLNAKIPLEWKELREVEQKKIEKVNNFFKTLVRTKKEQPNSRFLSDVEDSSYEEKFLNLFPELNDKSEEKGSILKELSSKSLLSKEDHIPGFETKSKLTTLFDKLPRKSFMDDESGESEMSKMMKEFKSKDRSACTKKIKDKMTCYVCNDKDGIKREECMYIVDKEPTKAVYRESSQTEPEDIEGRTLKREIQGTPNTFKYKYVPPGDVQPASQTLVRKTFEARKYGTPTTVPNLFSNVQIHTQKTYSMQGAPTRKVVRRRLPKFMAEPQALGSSKRETYEDGRSAGKNEDVEHVEDPEETGEYTAVEVVPEADPSSPDGAFSDDTEIVYDKDFKTSLPKFMVEKNEHEKIIDEFISRI